MWAARTAEATGFDWQTAGVFATALVAIIAVVVEGRRTRRQIGVENMWRLIDQWDSPAFRRRRSEAALCLLDSFPSRVKDVPQAVIDVLDMFELLGYLVVRSKTLDKEDAWINFSSPAIAWWHVAQPIVAMFRETDETIYEDYTKLAAKFLKEESKRTGRRPEELAPDALRLQEMLKAEAGLNPPPAAPRPWWKRRS